MIKNWSRWSMLIILFLSLAAFSFGQQITVSGTVTDEADGSTLIGVTVLQKGTTNGATTDIDGKYTLTVDQGSTLVFSYIGYDNIEIVANQEVIDVALPAKSELLEEIIVIGYGTQKKTDKTGAVSQVDSEDLNNKGALQDPIQGLQGKAAGVSITKKGGDPNAGFSVRIRGASGYSASTDPLYVIDGIPGADPTAVAPEDIESYNILKDAASTAIYGSRGSNGVIIITTKKGGKKNGEMVSQVNFTSKYSFETIAHKYDLLDANQIRQYAVDYDYELKDGGANTDWQDELYRTGSTFENNLSFSGGSESSFYRASLTHTDWVGIMKGTEKERTTAQVNITHKDFNDKLTLNANLVTTFENNDFENYSGNGKEDVIFQTLTRNPTDPVFNSNGGYDQTLRVFDYENPISVINQITNIRDAKRYLGSLRADYKFIDGLTGTAMISYIRNDQEYSYFRPKDVLASADNGFASRRYENTSEKQFEGYFTYVKSVNNVHNINVVAGYSYRYAMRDGFWAQAENPQSPSMGADNLGSFVDVKWGDVGSWRNSETLIGFFGRAQYNYKSKYYLTASLRRDGSSKFGVNNKWGWFPTVSASWNMQDEAFLDNVSWLDQLKLRASYGVSGNQAFDPGLSIEYYVANGLATNPENGEQVITFKPPHNKNDDLKWERTAETNIGIDFAFLNSKLSGSIEVYKKNTTDLLYPRKTSVEGGNVSDRTWDNAGNIVNQGIELYLQAFVINKSNFTYKTSLTVAHNKSEWVELAAAGGVTDGGKERNGWLSGRGVVGDAFYIIQNEQGYEVSAFYLPEIVGLIDGDFVFTTEEGGYTTQLADAKRTYVGSPNPDVELGWSNNFTFLKNWTLDFSIRSMIGHQKYNATRMFMDAPADLPELNTFEDALDWKEKGRSSSATIATEYLEDATFVKLDYISFGYQFNTAKLKWIDSFKLFLSLNNVFTLTKYSGADPEIRYANLAYGWDQYNVYPKSRSITFGLTATF